MSHTVKVNIELRDRTAIEIAAGVMKLKTVEGTFSLYSSLETGFGIFLDGWRYPVVVKEDGSVAYDNFNGAWGDIKRLEEFKDWYGLAAVQIKCQELGWYTEFNEASHSLTVYHPDGGTITVEKGGVIDANGFVGSSCANATEPLRQALGGEITSENRKPEYNTLQAEQKEIN